MPCFGDVVVRQRESGLFTTRKDIHTTQNGIDGGLEGRGCLRLLGAAPPHISAGGAEEWRAARHSTSPLR